MDSVLRAFSIGFLLRSLFAGVSCLIAYKVTGDGVGSVGSIAAKNLFSEVLPIAVFSGVTIYSLHRSMVYPWIEHILNSDRGRTWRQKWPLISRNTIELLSSQWIFNAEPGKESQALSSHYSTWADYTHLQYAFAICIAVGSAVRTLVHPADYVVNPLLATLILIFLTSALISDWRLHAIREHVARGKA